MLHGSAQVAKLAGSLGEAQASLRAALSIYEDRKVPPIAEPIRAALASLTSRPGASLVRDS